MRALREFLSWTRCLVFTGPLIVLSTVFFGTISLVCSLFDRSGELQHRVAQIWARSLLRVSFIDVDVQGIENIDPSRHYVFACNHLSLMDVPVILSFIPVQIRFLAKASLFKVPFLGFHLHRAGHFKVVFDNPYESLKSMSRAAKIMQEQKVSVLIFPEGGRSASGVLQPFKEGAAYVAIKAGVPIVPVALWGTREILPVGSIHVRSGHVKVRIGKPIDTSQYQLKHREHLSGVLRQELVKLLAEIAPSWALGEKTKHLAEETSKPLHPKVVNQRQPAR